MSEENNSKNLSKIEREELIAICERLRGDSSDPNTEADINRLITFIRSRKYGLMFERHEEEVDRLLKDHLPAFYDAEDKTIKTKDTEDCNFLLEGDNLHSLKLLEKTHKGKIDVIYIDPPYNTGNKDFIYADSMVGQDDGFRHSKWLSFMKERLEIARELLSNEGVIFISIDDNEQAQLKLLCDGIFGEQNFICNFNWRKTGQQQNNGKNVATIVEYILAYSKKLFKDGEKQQVFTKDSLTTRKGIKAYNKYDEKHNAYYRLNPIQDKSLGKHSYSLTNPKTGAIVKSDFWRISETKYYELLNQDMIYWTNSLPNIKKFLKETDSALPNNYIDGYYNETGNKELKELFLKNIFNNPKPCSLIKRLLQLSKNKSATILDFFAGSGTTGQAVLELNQEDGGDRHFILCTNNENNICEDVTYQRLKTVITGIRPDGTKYSEGIKANLKYFKTDMVAFNDEELEDKLITSSECLMQLENSSLLSSPDIDIAYCDEDLPDIFANKPHLKTLYLLEDVLFNAEQAKYIESQNIEIKRIADCYYEGV